MPFEINLPDLVAASPTGYISAVHGRRPAERQLLAIVGVKSAWRRCRARSAGARAVFAVEPVEWGPGGRDQAHRVVPPRADINAALMGIAESPTMAQKVIICPASSMAPTSFSYLTITAKGGTAC